MKKIVTIIIVMCVTLLSVNAQKWDLLKPVTVEVFGEPGTKEATSVWISRINTGVSFISVYPSFNELDEMNGFTTMPLSKISMGYTRAHYTESDGKAVCNYSFSALLLLPTTGNTNVALGITGSLFNFSLGVGYDLKSGGVKHNLFGIFGVQFVL